MSSPHVWFTFVLVLHVAGFFLSTRQAILQASADQLLKLEDKCELAKDAWKLGCKRFPNMPLTVDVYPNGSKIPKTVAECPKTGPCSCGNPRVCTVDSNATFVVVKLTGEQNQPGKFTCNRQEENPVLGNCTSQSSGEKQTMSLGEIIGIIFGIIIGVSFLCYMVYKRCKILSWLKCQSCVKDNNTTAACKLQESEGEEQSNNGEDSDRKQKDPEGHSKTLPRASSGDHGDIDDTVTSAIETRPCAELDQPGSSVEADMIAKGRAVSAQPEEQDPGNLLCEREHTFNCGNGVFESNGAMIPHDKKLLIVPGSSPAIDPHLKHTKRGSSRKSPNVDGKFPQF